MKKILPICLIFAFLLAFSASCAGNSGPNTAVEPVGADVTEPPVGGDVHITPPVDNTGQSSVGDDARDSQYDIHIIPPGGDAEPPLIAEDDTPPHLATDIAKIHVLHGAMQFNIGEYVIDFENKEFWQYDGDFFIGETNELSTRDVAAENEGYEYGGKLDDDKIATFFEQCDQYGFTAWDENYDDIMLADGHRWYVLITYADGSEQVARGSNDYPATYDDMTGAFMDLTGEDVLLR